MLHQQLGETKQAFLERIERERDMADLQTIEAAKILARDESVGFSYSNAHGFDEVLSDLHRFRNTSRALTRQAIEVADEIKTDAFLEKWEAANN